MTAIMPGKHASKLVILLVIAALIDTIQAFDVWSYWREKIGEKARIWKKEAIGTPNQTWKKSGRRVRSHAPMCTHYTNQSFCLPVQFVGVASPPVQCSNTGLKKRDMKSES